AVACGYSAILTSDHGNCEEMVDPATGAPHTHHTVYPVPCLVLDGQYWHLSTNAGLSSITPTLFDLMGLDKPEAMTGQSLLVKPVPQALAGG
nr:2,3-bisphosphoglycerate-independent phosphoglycerate mutase [Gammaproteobacteria bacterium]